MKTIKFTAMILLFWTGMAHADMVTADTAQLAADRAAFEQAKLKVNADRAKLKQDEMDHASPAQIAADKAQLKLDKKARKAYKKMVAHEKCQLDKDLKAEEKAQMNLYRVVKTQVPAPLKEARPRLNEEQRLVDESPSQLFEESEDLSGDGGR